MKDRLHVSMVVVFVLMLWAPSEGQVVGTSKEVNTIKNEQELRLREQQAPPAVKRKLQILRQQKTAKKWTFDPVYTPALEQDIKHLAGAKVPPNFVQHIQQQNARAASLISKLPQTPRATSSCSVGTVSFDWRKYLGATPVRDQGQCGSCWIFGAHGAFEGSYSVLDNILNVDSSEQNTLDCNYAGKDCNTGGWPKDAFEYMETGSATETSYPYVAAKGACRINPPSQPYRLYTWSYVRDDDGIPSIDEMKEALCYYGPLAVGAHATDAWQSYGSEQVFNEQASGDVNHIVTLIGWDEDKKAWLIKNSWGPWWGGTGGYGNERGYMWIDYHSDSIGYGAAWAMAYPAGIFNPSPTQTVVRIREPIVTKPVTVYDGNEASPAVLFQPGDTVELTAGGCVQTGGHGRTWKRYVNPSGSNSDSLYYGSINIPGITGGRVPFRDLGCSYDGQHPDRCTVQLTGHVPGTLPEQQRYLTLGYADDDYGDNGYWSHDDGTEDQCRNSYNAWITLTITHNTWHGMTAVVSPHPVRADIASTITVHATDVTSGNPVNGNVVINGTVLGKTDQEIPFTFKGHTTCTHPGGGGGGKPIPLVSICTTRYPYFGYVDAQGYDRAPLDFGLKSRTTTENNQ